MLDKGMWQMKRFRKIHAIARIIVLEEMHVFFQ